MLKKSSDLLLKNFDYSIICFCNKILMVQFYLMQENLFLQINRKNYHLRRLNLRPFL